MATRYVNTASTAGGDGTTNNTTGATRAYASLSAWEAARQAILAEVEEVLCTGSAADATGVLVDGWTTTAAFYIHIRGNPDNANGRSFLARWSTTHYRLAAPSDFGATLDIRESYVRVTGIQIENTSADASYCVRCFPNVTAANSDIQIDSVFARDADATGGNNAGFFCQDGTYKIRNCVSVGNGGAGFRFEVGDQVSNTTTVDNCVAAANTGAGFVAFDVSGSYTLRNCYSGGNTGADISTNWDTITTCRTEDGSQSTTIAAYSTSSGAFFTNVTAGSEDFQIGSSSTLKDVGTDLSASFTTDIANTTRTGTWDIGVWEIPAATLVPLPSVPAQFRLTRTPVPIAYH